MSREDNSQQHTQRFPMSNPTFVVCFRVTTGKFAAALPPPKSNLAANARLVVTESVASVLESIGKHYGPWCCQNSRLSLGEYIIRAPPARDGGASSSTHIFDLTATDIKNSLYNAWYHVSSQTVFFLLHFFISFVTLLTMSFPLHALVLLAMFS